MGQHRHPFVFSTEASIDLSDDETLMRMMVQAGFDGVFVGIETPNEDSLAECSKLQNRNRDLVACVRKIQSFGLEVRGGFIVGFDSDTSSVFNEQIEMIQSSRIVTAMVGLLNAPRGSRLYQRITQEGRLITEVTGDNTDFSTNIVPRMGLEALLRGYSEVISGIYSPKPYFKRVREYLREYHPRGTNFISIPDTCGCTRLCLGLSQDSGGAGGQGPGPLAVLEAFAVVTVPAAQPLPHGRDLRHLRLSLPQSLPGESVGGKCLPKTWGRPSVWC